MAKTSKIDLWFEALIMWATTGRICEDLYFTLRHCYFHALAVLNPGWLPFARQAEKKLRSHDKYLRPEYSLIERAGLGWKWPFLILTIPALLTLGAVTAVDLPLLVVVSPETATDAKEVLSDYLKAIAAILSAFTSILLAVAALTVRVKTSGLAGADFLLNAVIRKRGFLPIVAFLSGTIFATLLGVVVSHRFPPEALNDYVIVSGLIALLALLVVFNLLRRTMQTLGTSELEELLTEELRRSLRNSLRDTLKKAWLQDSLSQRLEELGFARHVAIAPTDGHPTGYWLKKTGQIVAIDLGPLKRIQSILRLAPLPSGRNTQTLFVYKPSDDAPFITIQPNGNVTRRHELVLMTKEPTPSKRIDRLIQQAFVVGGPIKANLDWQRVRVLVRTAVQKDEITTVKAATNALGLILEDYLEIQWRVGEMRLASLEDIIGRVVYGFRPPNPSELRLHPLAADAARMRSQDCLDELLNCIYRLARVAFEKHNQKYFGDWMLEYHWAYLSPSLQEDDVKRSIAEDVTRRMQWPSNLLHGEIFGEKGTEERVAGVLPYALIYLRSCLWMLKASAERYDHRTFDAVMEHTMQFFKDELKGAKSRLYGIEIIRRKEAVAGVLQPDEETNEEKVCRLYADIADYKSLAYVIAGAWLVHQVEEKKLETEKVAPFLAKLVQAAPEFRDLLDLYAMPGMGGLTGAWDNPLQFDGWDWPSSSYSSTRLGTEFQIWVEPFYAFLLLAKSAHDISNRIPREAIRHTQEVDLDDLTSFLARVASVEYTFPPEYGSIPGNMSADDVSRAKERIRGLLDFWTPEDQAEDGPVAPKEGREPSEGKGNQHVANKAPKCKRVVKKTRRRTQSVQSKKSGKTTGKRKKSVKGPKGQTGPKDSKGGS